MPANEGWNLAKSSLKHLAEIRVSLPELLHENRAALRKRCLMILPISLHSRFLGVTIHPKLGHLFPNKAGSDIRNQTIYTKKAALWTSIYRAPNSQEEDLQPKRPIKMSNIWACAQRHTHRISDDIKVEEELQMQNMCIRLFESSATESDLGKLCPGGEERLCVPFSIFCGMQPIKGTAELLVMDFLNVSSISNYATHMS